MGMELKTNISLCLLMPESIWSVKIQFTILAIFFAIEHDPTCFIMVYFYTWSLYFTPCRYRYRNQSRSLSVIANIFSLSRANLNLNKKYWFCCSINIFVICFIKEFVFYAQFVHQVPLHVNITMWSYFMHVFCTLYMIYKSFNLWIIDLLVL